MELNLGKIQKLSTEQILDVILGEINKIYSSIKNGENLDKVCSRLGISPLKFGGMHEREMYGEV